MTVKEIEKRLLKLNARSRAKLAEKLLHGLDELSDAENEQLWAEEVIRRHHELSSSRAKARPANDVFREARSRLK